MSKQISSSESGLRQKRKFWQDHVESWENSKLSQAEYCRRQGLKAHRLCYWINKESAKSEQPLALVEIPMQKVTVRRDTALKLNVDSHYQIEIADHFSPETLKQILMALGRVA